MTDWDSLEDGLDEDESEEDELDEDELVADGTEVAAEADAELTEAEARRVASAQADEILAEAHDLSDEPRTGPYGDDPVVRDQWTNYLEQSLSEAAAERAKVQAVFDAEASAEAEDDFSEPVDFSMWDAASFEELVDRVTGAVPRHASRRAIADDEFERALALMEV